MTRPSQKLTRSLPLWRDVFYDLGSGAGNICLRVFMCTPVRKVVGIEFDAKRHTRALTAAAQLHSRRRHIARSTEAC